MPRARVTAYIGLGANLGDPLVAVVQALAALAAVPELELTAQSSLYRTAPVDSSGPHYVNAVAQISTSLTAPDLLSVLQSLEHLAGRERPYLNAPRTLDLDLLLYGDAHVHSARLTLPHPRMGQRAFVLLPLAQIAPELVSPSQLQSVAGQEIERLG
jgi:2-amino-4-hydroxy-6-hydroxymethyldihydropteridine diphosphokinase